VVAQGVVDIVTQQPGIADVHGANKVIVNVIAYSRTAVAYFIGGQVLTYLHNGKNIIYICKHETTKQLGCDTSVPIGRDTLKRREQTLLRHSF
jgi:hypothetical protein